MIKTEMIGDLIRTYSDEGRYVVRDGVSYEEAVDPAQYNRQYTEGEIIEHEELSEEEEFATVGRIMMGVIR